MDDGDDWNRWARRPGPTDPTRVPPDPAMTWWSKQVLIAIIVGLAVTVAVYRLVADRSLDQSAVLFVGVPAIAAIVVASSRPAVTVTGLLIKVATLLMLMSGIVLGETLVCMLMASPLVFLVCALVGVPIDVARRRRRQNRPHQGPYAIVALVLLASLEGAVPGLAAPAAGVAGAARDVHASPAQVEAALAAEPRFDRALPLFLRAGFPRPVHATGSGLHLGDRRVIRFVGDDHHGTTHTGDLVLQITERSPGRVVFTVVSDDTRVAQWLRWSRAEVTWRTAGDGGTRVRWHLDYERQLAPVWYFGPLQRYAASLAAGYLADTLSTPDG